MTRHEERDLVRRLADAEAGNDAALRQWLAATPEKDANTALYDVAFRAMQHYGASWLVLLLCIPFTVLLFDSLNRSRSGSGCFSVRTACLWC